MFIFEYIYVICPEKANILIYGSKYYYIDLMNHTTIHHSSSLASEIVSVLLFFSVPLFTLGLACFICCAYVCNKSSDEADAQARAEAEAEIDAEVQRQEERVHHMIQSILASSQERSYNHMNNLESGLHSLSDSSSSSSRESSSEKSGESECVICLKKIRNHDKPLYAIEIPCGHRFHYRCLIKWEKQKNTCPICRHIIIPSDLRKTKAKEEV